MTINNKEVWCEKKLSTIKCDRKCKRLGVPDMHNFNRKHERKLSFGRYTCRCADSFETNLSLNRVQIRFVCLSIKVVASYGHDNEPLCFIKGEIFLLNRYATIGSSREPFPVGLDRWSSTRGSPYHFCGL